MTLFTTTPFVPTATHMILLSATRMKSIERMTNCSERGHEDHAHLVAELGKDAAREMEYFVDLAGVADLFVDDFALA